MCEDAVFFCCFALPVESCEGVEGDEGEWAVDGWVRGFEEVVRERL